MKKRKGLIAAVVFIILVTAINQFLNYALVQPGLGRTMFYECKNNDYECLILGASHGSYGFDSSKMSEELGDRKSTRLNSSHSRKSRMPSSA